MTSVIAMLWLGCAAPPDAPVAERRPEPVPACLGDPPCVLPREIFVDYTELDHPTFGGELVIYDVWEVTRPVSREMLRHESELSLAVRLLVSEIGADRLVMNAHARAEATAILATVDNRLDPNAYDPLGYGELAPVFPGCGPEGDWGSCANPDEYLGMATRRALRPDSKYEPELLDDAVDEAVRAWWLYREGLVDDPTAGATSYVHRCGGAAYGAPTWRCDAHMGRPARDIPGANPFTGPTLFKAPGAFREDKGWYDLREVAWVDYEPRDDL